MEVQPAALCVYVLGLLLSAQSPKAHIVLVQHVLLLGPRLEIMA